MSVYDAMAASMGPSDVFDRACAFVEWVEEIVQETDIQAELHTGTGAALAADLFGGETETTVHVFDPKADMLADLKKAYEYIRKGEELAIKVLAEV